MRNQIAYAKAKQQKEQNWETRKVTSLQDLEDLVMDLPRAVAQPIYVLGRSLEDSKTITQAAIGEFSVPDLRLDTDRKAVVNMHLNKTAQVASAKYQIVDHADVIAALCDLLRRREMTDVQGYVIISHGGNKIKVRLIIKHKTFDEPGLPNNIMFGAEVGNSYDSSMAVVMRCFFMRVSCFNQFVVRNIIPETTFSRPHTASDRIMMLDYVTRDLEYAFEKLDDAGLTFKGYMEQAIRDEIIIQSPEQLDVLMKDIFKVDQHAEGIAALAKKAARVHPIDPKLHILTKWELLNAATAYASHTESLSPQVQDSIFYRAETKIFKPREIELPPVPQ